MTTTDVRLRIVPDEENHPHDHLRAYHEAGASTLVMPNGSLVSVSHREEVMELQLSLTLAVHAAWEEARR